MKIWKPEWFWPSLRLLTLFMVVFITFFGLRYERIHRNDSSNTLRNAQVTFCLDSNNRSTELKNFLNDLVREPRPEEYSYISDPKLRQGALDQARARVAEMREKMNKFGQPRDCEDLFPKPQEE